MKTTTPHWCAIHSCMLLFELFVKYSQPLGCALVAGEGYRQGPCPEVMAKRSARQHDAYGHDVTCMMFFSAFSIHSSAQDPQWINRILVLGAGVRPQFRHLVRDR